MRRALLAVAVAGAAVTVFCAGAAGAALPPVALRGAGIRVVVSRSPFSLTFIDSRTGRQLQEIAARGLPLRISQSSPQPNLVGDQGGYAPLSFVVGAHAIAQWPTVLWAGDDLLGGSVGIAYHPVAVLAVEHDGATWTLRLATDAPGSPQAELSLRFGAPGQVEVTFKAPQALPVSAVGDAFVVAQGERFFGFGERKDAVDQRGLYREAFAEEENFDAPQHQYWSDQVPAMGPKYTFPNGPGASYHPESSFISSRGYGILVGGSAPSEYDVGASNSQVNRFQVLAGSLSYTVQFGSPATVIRALTAITGRQRTPPRYALEPEIDALVSTGNASSAAAMESDANTMASTVRADHLPVKVLGIEMWSSIPPAASAELARALRREGFVPYAYFWPFVSPGSQQYAEGARLGLLIKNAAGQPYVYSGEGGTPVAMWDFTNPKVIGYWQRSMLAPALDDGYGGFMLDFGEEILPGMQFHNGASWWVEHNAYPVQYARAVRLAVDRWRATHEQRPVFFYTRSGFSGEQRWSGGVFPGDEATDWSQANGIGSLIPMMVNLSVEGASMWSTDIGGYSEHNGAASPELYSRWVELGALSPMMRVHSALEGQRWPWTEGARTLSIYRTYAELHHRLVAYLLRAARQTPLTGLGIARPLWLEDMRAPESALETEYLLGSDLLVAPVLTPAARSRIVYLPRGSRWRRLLVTSAGRLRAVGAAHRGGTTISAAAPLGQIPVFLREGARAPA